MAQGICDGSGRRPMGAAAAPRQAERVDVMAAPNGSLTHVRWDLCHEYTQCDQSWTHRLRTRQRFQAPPRPAILGSSRLSHSDATTSRVVTETPQARPVSHAVGLSHGDGASAPFRDWDVPAAGLQAAAVGPSSAQQLRGSALPCQCSDMELKLGLQQRYALSPGSTALEGLSPCIRASSGPRHPSRIAAARCVRRAQCMDGSGPLLGQVRDPGLPCSHTAP